MRRMHFLYNAKFQVLFLLSVTAIMFFNRLDQATLIFDDCYYGQKAKEMAETHNYLVPTYGYKFDVQDGKPILYYWFLIVPGKIFGFNNFSMRLVPAIFGFIGIIATYLFAKKYFGGFVGFVASIVLIFTQQYMKHSRTAQPDIIFSVFFMLALVSFYIATAENKKFYFYLMGLFTALAVMTRNAPGLFVFFIIFIYIFLTKNFKILKNYHFYLGILFSLLIFLPWHLWMIFKFGNDFIQSYLGKLISLGITGAGIYTPWYVIIGRILETYWPWLPFLGYGFYKEIKNLTDRNYCNEEKNIVLFLLLWCFIPFLIFQAAKVKGTQYIMPIYIPFAIIVARVFESFKNKENWSNVLIIFASVVTLLYLLFPLSPYTLDGDHYRELSKIFPIIEKVNSDIIATHTNYWYFSNGIRFYTNKNVVADGIADIKIKCNSKDKHFFIMFKDEFLQLGRNIRIDILGTTEKFIFFKNKSQL